MDSIYYAKHVTVRELNLYEACNYVASVGSMVSVCRDYVVVVSRISNLVFQHLFIFMIIVGVEPSHPLNQMLVTLVVRLVYRFMVCSKAFSNGDRYLA